MSSLFKIKQNELRFTILKQKD